MAYKEREASYGRCLTSSSSFDMNLIGKKSKKQNIGNQINSFTYRKWRTASTEVLSNPNQCNM